MRSFRFNSDVNETETLESFERDAPVSIILLSSQDSLQSRLTNFIDIHNTISFRPRRRYRTNALLTSTRCTLNGLSDCVRSVYFYKGVYIFTRPSVSRKKRVSRASVSAFVIARGTQPGVLVDTERLLLIVHGLAEVGSKTLFRKRNPSSGWTRLRRAAVRFLCARKSLCSTRRAVHRVCEAFDGRKKEGGGGKKTERKREGKISVPQ